MIEDRPSAALERLRDAHRSARAPAALRQRALARARQLSSRASRGSSLRFASRARTAGYSVGAAVALMAMLWLVRGRPELDPGARGSAIMLSSEPLERRASAPGPCPRELPASNWNPSEVGFAAKMSGLETHVLETQTEGCGPLTRRYLARVPAGGAARAPAPVLLVLHDRGENAEAAQISTRWYFDDLGHRERAVLIYPNGAPSASGDGHQVNAGGWQTDEGAHPRIDDVAYLRAIMDDLRARQVIGANNEVFLAGYGSGALMALTAAARNPELYSGVAAFLPPRPLQLAEVSTALSKQHTAAQRLRAVLFVFHDPSTAPAGGESPSALVRRWGAAFGSGREPLVTKRDKGIEQIDTTLGGHEPRALRILRLPRDADPFPLPGGGDPTARAASEAKPHFLDGPGEAWAFFTR